jgi:voltage-gated potassium channel Kch
MKLILTPFDYKDLLAGHSFNTLTQTGQEVDVCPQDFDARQLAVIGSGGTATVTIAGHAMRVSRDLPVVINP